VYTGISNTPISYGEVDYPDWADAIGWGMVGLALVFIPILAMVEYCKATDIFKVDSCVNP
jgi:hypothetical protein